MKQRGRPFVLTPMMALAHASPMLAINPQAIGGAFALPASVPPLERGAAVAIVRIDGPLMQRETAHLCGVADGYDAIEARFCEALGAPDVGAVVLVIDSPGGDVAGCWEAVRRMRVAREAAGKPVFAYADEMIASAAYALATVADRGVYLPPSGEVGSIGVLCMHMDQSGALASDGLKPTFITSGRKKIWGNSFEPLSDEVLAAMQSDVDLYASQFFALVADATGLSAEAIAALEGACFIGQRAVDVGLAKGLANLENVMSMAYEAAKETVMNEDEKKELEALRARVAELEEENAALKAEDEEPPVDEPAPEEEDEPEAKSALAENKRLKAELAKRDIVALVDQACIAGRLTPAKRAHAVSFGTKYGAEALKEHLDGMPVAPVKGKATEAENTTAGLSAVDKQVAAQLGLTEAQFAAHKAAQKGAV